MADKMHYARSIKNLATMYKDMVAASEALEQLGSVEQAIEDGKKIIARLADDMRAAKADKAAAADELAAYLVEMAATKHAAETDARTVRSSIISGAEVDAAEIVKKAQDDAAKLIADASTEKARLSSEIGGLQKATSDLKQGIEALRAQHLDVEAQYKDSQAKLDALKGKFKALLD